MNSSGRLVGLKLFAKAERILRRVNRPLILSRLLHASLNIAVSLRVHFSKLGLFLECASLGRNKILRVITLGAANAKSEVAVLSLSRHLVIAGKSLAKRFAFVALILSFFYLVKLLRHPDQVLGLNNSVNTFRSLG